MRWLTRVLSGRNRTIVAQKKWVDWVDDEAGAYFSRTFEGDGGGGEGEAPSTSLGDPLSLGGASVSASPTLFGSVSAPDR